VAKKKVKPKTIELGKDDCAIVFREKNDGIKIEIPDGDDNDLMSCSVLKATALLALLTEGKLNSLINNKMELLFSKE